MSGPRRESAALVATILLYEKTGSRTGNRLRAVLEAAGHEVLACDLASHAWGGAELYAFFVGLPTAQWFDPGSPRVRSGDVVPDALGEEEAICLLLDDPSLIRRPLLQFADWREVGFDEAAIDRRFGLGRPPGWPRLDPSAAREPPSSGAA
jgi:nitrogenase-associated protein